MFNGNVIALLTTVIFGLALIQVSTGLECYICGDDSLDEYGECHAQFRYDCTNYAKNFEPSEVIFCRTMRKRTNNGTYTIMKECISQRDHYRTFPPKQYLLDDVGADCDLIDVDGDELAYCLCRQNLCNMKNIVDQFIDFEDRHSEILGSVIDDEFERSEDSTEHFPLAAARNAAQIRRSQIRNFNQDGTNNGLRTLKPVIAEGQLYGSVAEEYQDYVNSGGSASKHTHITTQSSMRVLPSPSEHTDGPTVFMGTIKPNMPSENSAKWGHANSNTRKFAALERTAEFEDIKQQNIGDGNLCYSCTEDLKDPTKDCTAAVPVQCALSRTTGRSHVCITKQTRAAKSNLYRLEKRCSTDNEEQEMITFGDVSSRKITCTATVDGAEAYCLCTADYCNRDSLLKQAENEAQSDAMNIAWNNNSSVFSGNSDVVVSAAVLRPLTEPPGHFSEISGEFVQATEPSRITGHPKLSSKSPTKRLFETTKRFEQRWKDASASGSSITSSTFVIQIERVTLLCLLSVLIFRD